MSQQSKKPICGGRHHVNSCYLVYLPERYDVSVGGWIITCVCCACGFRSERRDYAERSR